MIFIGLQTQVASEVKSRHIHDYKYESGNGKMATTNMYILPSSEHDAQFETSESHDKITDQTAPYGKGWYLSKKKTNLETFEALI